MPAPAWSAQRRERSEVIEAYGADFAEDARRRLLLDLLCRQVRRKHQPQFQTSLRTPERWDCSAVEVLKPSSSPLEFEWPTSQQSTIRSPRLAFWPTVRPGVLTGCSCFRVIATASRAGRSREQAHTPRPGWRGRSGQRANGLAGLSRLHQSLRLLSSPGSSRLESRRASETTLSKRISFPACPSSVGLGLLRSGARCARVVGACRPRAFLPHPVNHRSRLARHPGGAAAPAPRKMSQQGANPVIDERARRVKNLLEAYYGAEGHHHAHGEPRPGSASCSRHRDVWTILKDGWLVWRQMIPLRAGHSGEPGGGGLRLQAPALPRVNRLKHLIDGGGFSAGHLGLQSGQLRQQHDAEATVRCGLHPSCCPR